MEVRQTLPTDWNPEWHAQQQTRQYKPVGRGLTPDSKFWIGLALILWLGIPVWSAAAFTVPSLIVLAVLIYGLTAIMVPWALLSTLGWRRTLRLAEGTRWMAASAAGSVVGGGLIALMSYFALS